jgi:3-deoxy-manno-octulosonate cytidylyltransferase (CMP-KDO synthetase)
MSQKSDPSMRRSQAAVIAIPARRASSRLPNKLLQNETGKPLLAYTIERAALVSASSFLQRERTQDVWVVCDDAALAAVARRCGVGAVMTGECVSGTERIVAALPELPSARVIVNLQADEPEMPVEWILATIEAFEVDPQTDVATVAVPIFEGEAALDDPNVVKVVLDHNGYAMYFSRAAIPAVRSGGRIPVPRALWHVGLYAYRRDFLERYSQLPPSDLEAAECLEQLRFLQAGARIKVLVRSDRERHGRGIDTADDYQQFVERQRGQLQGQKP